MDSTYWIFANCSIVFVNFPVAALQWRLCDRSGQRHAEEGRQNGWSDHRLHFARSSHGKPGGLQLTRGRRWRGMKWGNENRLNGVIIQAGARQKIPITLSLHRACSTCTSTKPSTGMSKAITSCWRHTEGSSSWTLVCNAPPLRDILSWHYSSIINKKIMLWLHLTQEGQIHYFEPPAKKTMPPISLI